MAKKRVIWTNNVDTSSDAIKAYRKNIFGDESISDQEIIRLMCDDNTAWLRCEEFNLNIETAHPILTIANLGLWNGRRTAYKVLANCNVKQILSITCGDFVTFYADQFNVHCEDIHHDGTNFYLFRELTGDEDSCAPLLDALYCQKDEMTIKNLMRRYSRSILPYVADVYGWPVAGRKKGVV